VAHARPDIEIWAADIDPGAIALASKTLAPFGAKALVSDMDGALPASVRGRVAVLASCPPYVPTGEVALMPPEARDHEPRHTLDGGPDGLDLLRRISASAPEWLAPGGHALIEVSEHQLPAAIAVFEADGLVASSASDDELGATVVIGRRS
jgi:release factor glutamine methyltransferase